VELNSEAYTLNSTTIDLCMSLFSLSAVLVHPVRRQDAYSARSARLDSIVIRVTTAHAHDVNM
jgi:hypothetical protein